MTTIPEEIRKEISMEIDSIKDMIVENAKMTKDDLNIKRGMVMALEWVLKK